jgi:uncharacterized protein YoxC
MSVAAKKFVTQEQHEALAAEVRTNAATVERLAVRVEVISHDTTKLLREVADLREEMNQRFEDMETRFDGKLAATQEAILKEVRDGHATLLSAILQLAKAR